MADDRYLAFMGKGPKQVPHWEHFSNPDAETFLTGIDYYKHPRLCRLKLHELYPQLELPIPESDNPKTPPTSDDTKNHTVRWGDGQSGTFLHGEAFFHTPEDVFSYHPLDHADLRRSPHIVEALNYSSEDILYEHFRKNYPAQWGDTAPEGSSASAFFYNTTFMWPMLTFGWELFMTCCLDDRFEPVMKEFDQINRRVFGAFARLPVNFVICHDDIVTTRGPVCSPQWMHKYVFPRYEEYWDMVKKAGKEVIFMADGCMNEYADDIFACGARGIISEPYTNYKRIAKNHPDCFIAGEGDNRILSRNDPAQIRKMVENMVETAHMSGGYMMCIGNHIPWNVPGDAIKRYLNLSMELAVR